MLPLRIRGTLCIVAVILSVQYHSIAASDGLCDGGQVNSGRCRDASLCCSKWGWCGAGEPYCGPDSCRGGPCRGAQQPPPSDTTPSPAPSPSPSPSPSPAPSPSPDPVPSPEPAPTPNPAPSPAPGTAVCGGGTVGVCADPSMCCSQWGHCGREEAWCGAGCMSGPCWGTTPKPVPTPTPDTPPTDPSPSPPPSPSPEPSPPLPPPSPPAPPLDTRSALAGYYMSWSDPWSSSAASSRLASTACYVPLVLLSFMKPDATWDPAAHSLAATGLEFSSSPAVVRDAVAALKARCPRTRVLAALGGATYHNWGALNAPAIAAAVAWLGLDGVDVDYEVTPSCTATPATANSPANVACSTDAQITSAIHALRAALPRPRYEVTAAVFSVGAYGVGNYVAAPPASVYTGMWVRPLRDAGHHLDRVLVMSYDAGPQPHAYDPRTAFAAYRALYPGPLLMGVEVPPEAWGGNVLTLPMLADYNAHFKAAGGQGMMLWALQKAGSGGATPQAVAQAVCVAWELGDCAQPLFAK